MPYFIGIDGGGSSLRVVIVNHDLHPLAEASGTTANPNIIGHDTAKQHIQTHILQTLTQANLNPTDISAIGIGIAGASNEHSERWLRETIEPLFTQAHIIPSSDFEIALVGALAQRHGILILAGTGSTFFGRNPFGDSLRIGGWGYLLGDEGSGYWIGLQVLKRIIQDFDGNYASHIHVEQNQLNKDILDALGLSSAREIVAWLYRDKQPAVKAIAGLAQIVIQEAERDNWSAINVVQSAAIQLVNSANILKYRLDYATADIAFAGGLLSNDNYLSREVTKRLHLAQAPSAKYPPVIGAALLAKMEWEIFNSGN